MENSNPSPLINPQKIRMGVKSATDMIVRDSDLKLYIFKKKTIPSLFPKHLFFSLSFLFLFLLDSNLFLCI